MNSYASSGSMVEGARGMDPERTLKDTAAMIIANRTRYSNTADAIEAIELYAYEGLLPDDNRFSPWEREVLARAMDMIDAGECQFPLNALLWAWEETP